MPQKRVQFASSSIAFYPIPDTPSPTLSAASLSSDDGDSESLVSLDLPPVTLPFTPALLFDDGRHKDSINISPPAESVTLSSAHLFVPSLSSNDPHGASEDSVNILRPTESTAPPLARAFVSPILSNDGDDRDGSTALSTTHLTKTTPAPASSHFTSPPPSLASDTDSEDSVTLSTTSRTVFTALKASLQSTAENTKTDVLEKLKRILENSETRVYLCSLKGDKAQCLLNHLQSSLLQPAPQITQLQNSCLAVLYELSNTSALYPYCYKLSDIISESYRGGGGFSDIHQARFGGQHLCLKVVRLYQSSDMESMLKHYAKEAIRWSHMNHPNIAPFYGIYYRDEARRQLCLVSPWMDDGNIIDYLKQNPLVSPTPFIYDVTNGLEYLHEQGLVHANLKGTNVLVNRSREGCLTDLGLSSVYTDPILANTAAVSTAQETSCRWFAPELLEDGIHATVASDMWALGCVFYEVLTGTLPFDGLDDIQALSELMDGGLPAQYDQELNPDGVEGIIWNLVDRCWVVEPGARPACRDILHELELNGLVRVRKGKTQDRIAADRQKFREAMMKQQEPQNDLIKVEEIFDELLVGKSDSTPQSQPRQLLKSGYQGFLSSLPCPYHQQMAPLTLNSSMEKVFPPCAPDGFLPYTEEILNYQAPGAPRRHCVPLPLLASAVTSLHNHEASHIYPLEIRSSLPLAKKIELQTIVLTPPIHIHTPRAHIGTIFGNTPGERLYALDIFFQFQAMISQTLDYHMTYSQLPSAMKIEVEAAFMRRRGQSFDAVTSWREFLSGRPSPAGPISYDLLLGHHAIWGFESYCIGGYSVVHLA